MNRAGSARRAAKGRPGWTTPSSRVVGGRGEFTDLANLQAIPEGILGNTLCALGDAAAMPVLSFMKKFGHEFEYFIANRRSLNGDRLEA